MPGAVLRAGGPSLILTSGSRKQWPGVMCAPAMEERIWDGLGFLPPDYQHVLAMLPQGDIVLEEVHNQRALPVKVEEVGSYLRAFAGRVRLSGKDRRKKLGCCHFYSLH